MKRGKMKIVFIYIIFLLGVNNKFITIFQFMYLLLASFE